MQFNFSTTMFKLFKNQNKAKASTLHYESAPSEKKISISKQAPGKANLKLHEQDWHICQQ